MFYRLHIVIAVLIFGLFASASAVNAEQEISFRRDVRPILSNACFHCHGPDEETREADLRLDQQEGLLEVRGDYQIVKPGDAGHSELLRRILSDDADVVMPPAGSNKSITAEQKEILQRWIQQGAAWEQHWAFAPPERPQLPSVTDSGWPKNDIDHFVLARLESAGLHPSPPANPSALLRRVYLDLIGLPPTPEEAETGWAKSGLPRGK